MAPAVTKLGAKGGNVQLSDETFAAEWNEHLVWHVVRNELLWRRQGSHATKSRGMVRGGGAKPWRQKGTGRARQGTRRAPQWAGGGVVFGPSPRQYGGKVNRKERLRALRVALSMHQTRGSLGAIGDDLFDTPSTKTAAGLRSEWGKANGKLVVVCLAEQENVQKSFRNLPNTQVVAASDLDVADVMWGRALIATESALKWIEERS
jgi:large subunit ribosomal protein L4